MANGVTARQSMVIVGLFWTIAVVLCGAFWTIVQDKFSVAEKRDVDARADLLRVQREMRNEVTRIDAELLSRRSEFVGQPEFKQFLIRVDSLVGRLAILEQTRPTTGELQAVAKSNETSLNDLMNRIRALEATTPRIVGPSVAK